MAESAVPVQTGAGANVAVFVDPATYARQVVVVGDSVASNVGLVDSAGAQVVKERRPATATITTVSAATSSTTVLAANTGRLGAVVMNDSTAVLYLRLDGGTASTSTFSFTLQPGERYELPYPAVTSALTAIWSSAVGQARITELT